MRELVLRRWCDICAQEVTGGLDIRVNVEATHTYTVGIVAGETRPALKLLELCDTHNKVATELLQLMGSIGQTPEMPAKPKPAAPPDRDHGSKRMVECPACLSEHQRSTMVAHVWKTHRTDKRPDLGLVCPDCRERVTSGTGMAAHRRGAHGHDALQDALSGVDDRQWPAIKAWRANGAQL